MPNLTNMKSWTERYGRTSLRSFSSSEGNIWVEQNATKASKWARFARQGHEVAWEFAGAGGGYTGRMLIDGDIYTPGEATKKFLSGPGTDTRN